MSDIYRRTELEMAKGHLFHASADLRAHREGHPGAHPNDMSMRRFYEGNVLAALSRVWDAQEREPKFAAMLPF